jgi:hypothetical protein
MLGRYGSLQWFAGRTCRASLLLVRLTPASLNLSAFALAVSDMYSFRPPSRLPIICTSHIKRQELIATCVVGCGFLLRQATFSVLALLVRAPQALPAA